MAHNYDNFNHLEKIVFYSLWFPLILFLFYSTITFSLPAVASIYIGKDFREKSIVLYKTKKHVKRRRICKFGMSVKNITIFLNKKMCVSKNIWDSIEIGDSILILGKESFMGKKIISFDTINANQSFQPTIGTAD